jgi:hypothetical protein
VPDGDVVWYTAQRLHAALAGQVLTRGDLGIRAGVPAAAQALRDADQKGRAGCALPSHGITSTQL